MYEEKILRTLSKITREKDIHLEVPVNLQFGDYSSNIAMVSAKKLKKNPRDLAEEIKKKLLSNKDIKILCGDIKVEGPGFINFYLKKDILIDNLIHIDSIYGSGDSLNGKKLMFEFAHPNTHKAFHIGHLRNITTGEALSRISEFTGAKVIRANYQGDIGLHIAKALYGIKLSGGLKDPKDVKSRAEYLGKIYAKGATAFEESEEAKKEVGEINKKIYSKEDEEVNKLYQTTRRWSLDYFDSIYKRVYTKFDRLFFESECAEEGKKIALEALKKGILEKSDGAIIFPGKKYGLHDRVFISGKGVPTYEAKDFGLVKLQLKEYNPDKIIHVLGPEQLGYTEVIFKAQELAIPETKGKQLHLPYGWVRLKKGKMSSRSGNVVYGEDLLDQAKEEVVKKYKTDEKTAEIIAVGAVKYYFLKTGLNQEIAFDVKESVSLEGNSGPYLQYTVARTNSVLAKSSITNNQLSNKLEIKTNKEEKDILRTLIHFPEVVEEAAQNYAPNLLCNYLYQLASQYNTLYAKCPILTNSDQQVTNFRLTLTSAVGQVLKNGLNLLGIQVPERM